MLYWLLRILAVAVTLTQQFPSGWRTIARHIEPVDRPEQLPSSYG